MVFRFILTVLIGVLGNLPIKGNAMDLSFEDPKLLKYLTSGFISKHVGADRKFNENNQGLGFMLSNGIGGGYYKNSLGKDSLYLVKELEKELGRIGQAKLMGTLDLGAVTGYHKPLTPVVLPGIGAELGNNRVNLGMVPPIPGVTPLTLALQYRRKF